MTIYAHTASVMPRPKVVLNMIVKDEAHVIERCLNSVKPFIDYWVIVDTGSTDTTRELITTIMQSIPGELHSAEWVNFEHNRNDALRRITDPNAYVLFIDADELLVAPAGFQWPALTADGYNLPVEYAGTSYDRLALVANRLTWCWEGVVHEYLRAPRPDVRTIKLSNPHIEVHHDGARTRDPQTYVKDAALLEKALDQNPDNPRTVFYLAQSYRDAGQTKNAISCYERRAAMPGWDEETWFSKYQVAILKERIQESIEAIRNAYLVAYQFRPTRAEPLYQLTRLHRERNEWALAYMFGNIAKQIQYPANDKLFIDASVYRWRIHYELSIICYYVGEMEIGACITEQLLDNPHIPEAERTAVRANQRFYPF